MRESNRIGPEEELFLELGRASQLARKFADEALSSFDVTPAEYNLLRIVERHKGVTASEAQERLMVAAPSITQLVRSLEQKKFLRRERSVSDARVQHLYLAGEGKNLLSRARAEIRKRSAALLPEEPALRSMIHQLHSLIGSLSSSPH